MSQITDELQEFCDRAVRESASENIPDFHYFGGLDHGETWARTFSVNRDSDTVERSNFDEITKDLEEKFPDDTHIERSSHWACGWIDSLSVRMLEEGKPTNAACAVWEWKEALENYPVANDEALSKLEWEEAYEALEWVATGWCTCDDPDWVERLMDWLLSNEAYYESDSGGVYWSYFDWTERKEGIEDLVKKGLFEMGLLDEDYAYELWANVYHAHERGMM